MKLLLFLAILLCSQAHASDTILVGDSTIALNKWDYDTCATKGATVGDLIGMCDASMRQRVVISVGVNDVISKANLAESFEQYRHLALWASGQGRKVILCTIPYYGRIDFRRENFNDFIIFLSEKEGYEIIRLDNMLNEFDTDDGLHPNEQGYDKWEKALA